MSKRREKTQLGRVILADLFGHGKLLLLLITMIVVSAFFVISTTNKTRILRNEYEQLTLEQDALENEWRNLLLEENVLAKTSRVERIAFQQLKMQKVTPENEIVIKIKRANK